MTPISLNIDNAQVTLKSIERNKVYKCTCEDEQINCHLKQKLSVRPSAESLVATEALVNVRNTSSEVFPIDLSYWELIDADGKKFPVEKRMALCRCGASTEKPFCDGTHSKIGFQAAQKAVPESKE